MNLLLMCPKLINFKIIFDFMKFQKNEQQKLLSFIALILNILRVIKKKYSTVIFMLESKP